MWEHDKQKFCHILLVFGTVFFYCDCHIVLRTIKNQLIMVEMGPKEQKRPIANSRLNQAHGKVDKSVKHTGKS